MNIRVRWKTEHCQGPWLADIVDRMTEYSQSMCPVYRPSKDFLDFHKYFYGRYYCWKPLFTTDGTGKYYRVLAHH